MIVRVDAVTVCGTDLHIRKGEVPEVTPGRVLGHEAVGTVAETGGDVRTVRPGDRVLVSCICACGRCRFCRESRYGQCRGGEAGSSVTPSTAPRPSTSACPSPTCPSIRCPTRSTAPTRLGRA